MRSQKAPRPGHPKRTTGTAAKPARTQVWVRNETTRAGVPLTVSFERWIDAALRVAKRRARTEVNVLIVGTDRGREFNARFRARDYATNVLSFPYEPMPHERTHLIGDLVICAPVVAREAREQRKRVSDHYAHMTVHGLLHLIGFDHLDEADAEYMEALERRILAKLGILDPYLDCQE